MRCWHIAGIIICLQQGENYLHGPADAIATKLSLALLKSRMCFTFLVLT